MHAAGLVREQVEHLGALVLGVEILGAQLGVVEDLDAVFGTRREVGHVGQFGQRKAPRCCAVQDVGYLGGAVTREVKMLRRRPHLRAGEMFEAQAAVGFFLQLLAPLDEVLRLKMLRTDEVGDLDFKFLLRTHDGGETECGCCGGSGRACEDVAPVEGHVWSPG